MAHLSVAVKLPSRDVADLKFDTKQMALGDLKAEIVKRTVRGDPDGYILSFGAGKELKPKLEAGPVAEASSRFRDAIKSGSRLQLYLVKVETKGVSSRRRHGRSASKTSDHKSGGSKRRGGGGGGGSSGSRRHGRHGSSGSGRKVGSAGRRGSKKTSSGLSEVGYAAAYSSVRAEAEEEARRIQPPAPDAIPQRFMVKCSMEDGASFRHMCRGDAKLEAFLRSCFVKIKGLNRSISSVDDLSVRTAADPNDPLAPSLRLIDLVYVQEVLAARNEPSLHLVAASRARYRMSSRLSAFVYASGNLDASVKSGSAKSPSSSQTSFAPSGPSKDMSGAAKGALDRAAKAIIKSGQVPVRAVLPDGTSKLIETSPSASLDMLKRQIYLMAKERNIRDLRGLDKYILKLPGDNGFLKNEKVKIKDSALMDAASASATVSGLPKLTLVLKPLKHREDMKEKLTNGEITELTGPLEFVTAEDDEISVFRRHMYRTRVGEVKLLLANPEGPSNLAALNVWVNPGAAAQLEAKAASKLMLRVLTGPDEFKTVAVASAGSVSDAISAIADKLSKAGVAKDMVKKKPADLVLRVVGLNILMSGSTPLLAYEFIQNCIRKERSIHVSLLARADIKPLLAEKDRLLQEKMSRDEIDKPDLWFDHKDISTTSQNVRHLKYLSSWDIDRPFRVRVHGIENLEFEDEDIELEVWVEAGLYHGGRNIGGTMFTKPARLDSPNPRFYEWLSFSKMAIRDLPHATRVCFTLWGKETSKPKSDGWALGWVNAQLVDHRHNFLTGLLQFNLWDGGPANPIGTCVQNLASNNPSQLFVEFDSWPTPVVFPKILVEPGAATSFPEIDASVMNRLNNIVKSDPLAELSDSDRKLVWSHRHYVRTIPHALSKFLLSVNWTDRRQVEEAHRLTPVWAKLDPWDALELLDAKFADATVRKHAVRLLKSMSDEDVQAVLLQLVQVLKYEPYHDSPLAEFLLKRALRNRLRIGHDLFWHLKAEMHVPEVSERYGLLLEQYLRAAGGHRQILLDQNRAMRSLIAVAESIKLCEKEDRMEVLQAGLRRVVGADGDKRELPSSFQLPLSPHMRAKSLRLEKCKYMSSKKLPLWLVFDNADPAGDPIYVIFKVGDDLRQDLLTLQMLKIMDKLWMSEGLDLRLHPYGCVATGDEIGMIEVVLDAATTAQIQSAAGGIQGAFKEDPIKNWLFEQNTSEEARSKAVENFMYSCAGYCVGTYVLGIGDRHNDNVMVTRYGHLFHIDFGHFLGNYKKKFGVRRERAPFVFTADFAYVLGGKGSSTFNKFVEISCKAYNILRHHAHMFINLFAMMLSTGIPELKSADDIKYLRDAFRLDLDDAAAAAHFKDLIMESLASTATQINNAFHIFAHKKTLIKKKDK